jgi:hypothetical protein
MINSKYYLFMSYQRVYQLHFRFRSRVIPYCLWSGRTPGHSPKACELQKIKANWKSGGRGEDFEA